MKFPPSRQPLLLLILTLALTFLTSACKTLPPARDPGTTTLARELEEMRRNVEELKHRLSVVQFMVDSHERAISDLERSNTGGPHPMVPQEIKAPTPTVSPVEETIIQATPLPPHPPKKPKPAPKKTKKKSDSTRVNKTYTQAFDALRAKKYAEAIVLFREVAEKWPDHDLADNAIYWNGEIHYTKGDYSAAVSAFRTLLSKYPKGSKVPDALLKTGYAYLKLNDKDSARTYLKRVVVEYPFSTSGAKAEKTLNKMDETPDT